MMMLIHDAYSVESSMKNCILLACFAVISMLFSSCVFDEGCENEASQIRVSVAGTQVLIDTYEASRTNATAQTAGTGITMACNTKGTVPWGNVTYEDARNACLDAGKRLCTKQEWIAACGAEGNYTYGASYVEGSCVVGSIESAITGSKASCRSSLGVFDMSGNMREWVEGGILMGGSYNSSTGEVKCGSSKEVGDVLKYSPSAADGFRCCQDESLL